MIVLPLINDPFQFSLSTWAFLLSLVMKVATNIYTFLAVLLPLANALPSPRESHLSFRSSTLGNVAPDEGGFLDLLAPNMGPLTSPELPVGQADALDITPTATDNSPILFDSLATLSDPPNTLDSSLSPTGVADSTPFTCLDNCYYTDSSIPLASDPLMVEDGGNAFDVNPSAGGTLIPADAELGSAAGTWIDVHRGSGRGEENGSISSAPEGSGRPGSGREKSTDEIGLGNDLQFLTDEEPASNSLEPSIFA